MTKLQWQIFVVSVGNGDKGELIIWISGLRRKPHLVSLLFSCFLHFLHFDYSLYSSGCAQWGSMDGNFLTILSRFVISPSFLLLLVIHSECDSLFLLKGCCGCCISSSGVCFLCLLCSFCWEEDFSVCYDWHLYSSCKLSLHCPFICIVLLARLFYGSNGWDLYHLGLLVSDLIFWFLDFDLSPLMEDLSFY